MNHWLDVEEKHRLYVVIRFLKKAPVRGTPPIQSVAKGSVNDINDYKHRIVTSALLAKALVQGADSRVSAVAASGG